MEAGIVGLPNVGKSTLTNRILGEERVVVYDLPGTTRDSVFIPMQRDEREYILIDTAGVRKRRKVTDAIEKFSIVKTLQAIEEANVVLLVIDAREGITDQDLSLLGFVLNSGRSLVVAVNKWDGLSTDIKDEIKREMDRRLGFIDFARIHFISALHGSGVGNLYKSIHAAYGSATRKLKTPELNEILTAAIQEHQPPLVKGRRIKLRYAHIGGHNPPVIVIHGNQTDAVPDAYKRYLEKRFIKALQLEGTPIRIDFKTSDNPYKDRKNKLSERQVNRRRRMMKHVKQVKKDKTRTKQR